MDKVRSITRGYSLNGTIEEIDRPVERVWFATPSAEMKYKKIVRLIKQKEGHKPSRSRTITSTPTNQPTSDSDNNNNNKKKMTLISSKKRKISSIDTEEPISKKSKIITKDLFEDPFIASLGPIPSGKSDLFANMSFVLCYVEENDDEKNNKPFYSEARLVVQLRCGGGKVYESFKLVPPEEYKITKLITNTSSIHPQSMLCFNAGIPAYSYQWVIKCCQQNRSLDPKHDEIPPLTRELRRTIALSTTNQQRNRRCAESPF